ncbi:MAG: hypothetical protein IKZ33_04780 [Lentisphaeria bacterium]|nr:hypothetical protein [Lentisphaeria bacterium]
MALAVIRQGGFFVLSKKYSKLWRIEGKFNPLFLWTGHKRCFLQNMIFTDGKAVPALSAPSTPLKNFERNILL